MSLQASCIHGSPYTQIYVLIRKEVNLLMSLRGHNGGGTQVSHTRVLDLLLLQLILSP